MLNTSMDLEQSIILHILGIGGLTTLAIGLGYALMWAIAAIIEWINN